MKTEMEELDARIERIKGELQQLGAMRPGSISQQYRQAKSGRQSFYQLSYTHRMKHHTEHVRLEELETLQQETANFKRFRELTSAWVEAALALSRLKVRQARGQGNA